MSFVKRYIHRRLESYQSRIKSKYINVKKKYIKESKILYRMNVSIIWSWEY
jgi:hypothetical protein